MLDNDKLQSVIDEIRDKYGDKVIGYVSDKDNGRWFWWILMIES